MQSRSLGSRATRFTAITPGSEACLVQVAVATRAATAKARAEQFRVACSNGTRTLSRNTGASPGFRTFALFVDLLKAAQKVGFHFVKALLCGVTGCNESSSNPGVWPGQVQVLRTLGASAKTKTRATLLPSTR